jgi:hypothetical protein
MLNLNCHILAQVVSKALVDAAAHPRWVTAIQRALVELDTNPYLERQAGHLLIGSSSGQTYAANGVCSCTAFSFGQACWHRAAARLVRLHDEAQAAVVCQQPDTLCELHNPCPEHARAAAAYVAQEAEAIIEAHQSGLITMPEGDTLDTDGMRLARKIARARLAAQFNSELFA